MIPRGFECHEPISVEEVLALLDKHGDGAKLMAGGHSLLPMMKYRLASPAHVIGLWRVQGLDAIRETDNEIRIGALVTHRALENSEVLHSRCPPLAKAASQVGDAQVRNLGTIGGSAAHADPAANYPPVLVALGAKFVLRSKSGERIVAAAEFFKDTLVTELRPTEILTEIRIPVLAAGVGWEFMKLSRRASDFGLINVAVILRADGNGICTGADVMLGNVGPVPWRAAGVEASLRGKPLDIKAVVDAARATVLAPNTPSDVHADAAYRNEVAPVCVRRALDAAVARMKTGKVT